MGTNANEAYREAFRRVPATCPDVDAAFAEADEGILSDFAEFFETTLKPVLQRRLKDASANVKDQTEAQLRDAIQLLGGTHV